MDFISKCKEFFKKMNRNTILVCVAIIAIIIVGGLIFAKSNGTPSSSGTWFSFSGIFGSSGKQVGEKAIKYINDNQLASTPAELVGTSSESGLVKITIKIGTSQFDSYATKDGKFLFPQAFDMNAKKAGTATDDTKNTTPASVTKADKPVLEAFVVSSCPYGLQMQRALAEAVKNVPSLASNIVVRYIGSVSNGQITSMHDAEPNGGEAKENLRQICLREEQPTKFWNYLSCYMSKASGTLPNGMPLGNSTACQASTGVDTAKLNACVSDAKRGLAYAQKDFSLDTKYNVSGSPTLILNGAQISETGFGGRSADGVKSMVCAGSKTQPSFCSTKLNTAAASASFSATYTSSGSSSSAANCAPAK